MEKLRHWRNGDNVLMENPPNQDISLNIMIDRINEITPSQQASDASLSALMATAMLASATTRVIGRRAFLGLALWKKE